MDRIRVSETTKTNISWRDEISYSHDIKSEGSEKLREAIKQANSSSQGIDFLSADHEER
jgi:hypothetical protein